MSSRPREEIVIRGAPLAILEPCAVERITSGTALTRMRKDLVDVIWTI